MQLICVLLWCPATSLSLLTLVEVCVCVCVFVWDFQYIRSCCLWMEIMLFLLFQFFQKALDVSLDFSVYLAASHPGTPRPPCPAWVSCVSPPCVPFPTCPCCHAPPVLSSPVCLASCAVWVWLVPMETTEPAWDWHAVGLHALGWQWQFCGVAPSLHLEHLLQRPTPGISHPTTTALPEQTLQIHSVGGPAFQAYTEDHTWGQGRTMRASKVTLVTLS